LILALLSLLVLSAMAAGIIMTTESEMWTTSNYRQATQARYIAEAGAQQAVNWIQDRGVKGTLLPTGFPTGYNVNVYPLKDNGGNLVILAPTQAVNKISANYTSAQLTDFRNNLGAQTVSSAGVTGNFSAVAQLLNARNISGTWVTDWKIISQATVNNSRVQVVEVVSKVEVDDTGGGNGFSFDYGVLATGTGCGTIDMGGGQYTNSYNSQGAGNVGNPNPTLVGTGGNVASFGNISIHNGAYIYGNAYTPFSGSGAAGTYGISGGPKGLNGRVGCSSPTNMWAVNEDNSGSEVGCSTTSKTRTCPSNQVTYPLDPTWKDPSVIPEPVMPTVAANTANCTGYAGLCNGGNGDSTNGWSCSITIPPSTLIDGKTAGGGPANFGKVNFGSCAKITLKPGVYNMDTLYISNGAALAVSPPGPVVMNVMNASGSTTPLKMDGGTVANDGGNPLNISFVYAGNQTVSINAGTNIFSTIYAPHASVSVTGNGGLYGAIVGRTFSFSGSGHVVYDSNLNKKPVNFPVATTAPRFSDYHVDQFSWNAF
jgi:hypothetical protein